MSTTLAVPTVTQQDLLVFHSRTFGRGFELTPETPKSHDDYTAAGYEDEEDDGLGYYADGVKRTLTDEQIKMFRHSEIHSLRLRRLRAQELAEVVVGSGSDGEVRDRVRKTKTHMAQDAETGKPASVSSDIMDIADAGDEDAGYAKFREKERQEFAAAAAKQREDDRRDRYRMISTRRKVRELDSLPQEEVVLDY